MEEKNTERLELQLESAEEYEKVNEKSLQLREKIGEKLRKAEQDARANEEARREEATRRSKIGEVAAERAAATRELKQLVSESHYADTETVRDLVSKGADVCEIVNVTAGTIIHEAILTQQVEVLKELLATADPIDFTCRNDTQDTPLHTILVIRTGMDFDEDKKIEMLKLLMDRINKETSDTVDFSMKNKKGMDFINMAAQHRMLSKVWNVVKNSTHFKGPIVMTVPVLRRDWETISARDQQLFNIDAKGLFGPGGKYANE